MVSFLSFLSLVPGDRPQASGILIVKKVEVSGVGRLSLAGTWPAAREPGAHLDLTVQQPCALDDLFCGHLEHFFPNAILLFKERNKYLFTVTKGCCPTFPQPPLSPFPNSRTQEARCPVRTGPELPATSFPALQERLALWPKLRDAPQVSQHSPRLHPTRSPSSPAESLDSPASAADSFPA